MALPGTHVLLKNQFYYDKDTTTLKIGDGTTQLSELTNLLVVDLSAELDALNGTNIYMSAEEGAQTIATAVQNALNVALGAARAFVFDTEAHLDEWIAGTYTRPDGFVVANLHVGDHLLVIETDKPDYWWDGTAKQKLETQKVDLSSYYTSGQTDTAISTALASYSTTSAMETYVAGEIAKIPATDLSNYYTKEYTYSKTEVTSAINSATNGKISDAPNDGHSYVRRSQAWVRLVLNEDDVPDNATPPENGEGEGGENNENNEPA